MQIRNAYPAVLCIFSGQVNAYLTVIKKRTAIQETTMNIRQKIRNFVENRRAMQELQSLSDHALSDIGISRAQIRSAVLGR